MNDQNNNEPIILPPWIDLNHIEFNGRYLQYIMQTESTNEEQDLRKIRQLAMLKLHANSDDEKKFIEDEKQFIVDTSDRKNFLEPFFRYLTTDFYLKKEGTTIRNPENAKAVADMYKNTMTDVEVKIVYEASNENGEIHHNIEALKGLGD